MVRKPTSARPRRVTFICCFVFILGILNGWRAWQIGQQAAFLEPFAPTLDPRLRLLVSLIIVGVAVWLAAALWFHHPITRQAIPLFLLALALYRLTLLALWVQSPVARQGWGGEMVLYAAAIISTALILNHRTLQPYFKQP